MKTSFIHRLLIASVSWLSGLASAAVVNITFDDPSAADSFQHAQIAQHGTDGLGTHNFISWNSGNVSMTSRFYQPVSRVLIEGGEDDNGFWNLGNVEGALALTAEYDYANVDSDTNNGFVELAFVRNASGVNNYPSYFARVALNQFELYRHQAFNSFTIVDSLALGSTYSGSGFELTFSAENTDGTEVVLGASLSQNGVPIGSLAYTDPNGYTQGYVAIAGGDAFNSGTTRGVEFTSLGSSGFVVPEPGTFGLITLGILTLTLRRRFIR